MKVCVVSGCPDAAQARGMCWRHFGRWRRQGDPLSAGQHGGRRDEQQGSEAPDPGPLVHLRQELQASRARDVGFAAAWTAGVAIALDGLPERLHAEWTAVLVVHRPIWRAAYCREPGRPLFGLTPPEEPSRPYARTAPPMTVTGQRHDGAGTLEPVEVPWCR